MVKIEHLVVLLGNAEGHMVLVDNREDHVFTVGNGVSYRVLVDSRGVLL